ncbi:Pentatricopeptide repeat [Macleaya cordata]|uniref:Pentatricopeptide repeat n=1 Tax=Macleaya cordata TaxID=56857 RepID=A0A200QXM1_MACCD|nr:Pentatricopeptide repeat [Macleaya cordata]
MLQNGNWFPRIPCFLSLLMLPQLLIKHQSSYSFNSIIRTHLSSGHPEKALTNFTQFKEQGLLPDNFTIPSLLKLCFELNQPSIHGENIHAFAIKTGYLQDIIVSTGFVELYFNYGHFSASYQLFDEISERDVVLWTAMVSGFSHNGLGDQSVNFLSRMLREGIKPNRITLTSVLAACSQLMVLNLGRSVHGFSIRNGIFKADDVVLETAFVDMYAKCRNLIYSSRVFDRMRERNSVSWNAIITGQVNYGSSEAALRLFREMMYENKTEPRSSTLASVLQVCGGTTDLRRGREIHGHAVRSCRRSNLDSLVENNALIDMYAKSGDLNSAVLLFQNVRNKNLVTWTTMISGYGMHGLGKEALKAFDEMKKSGINPDGVSFIAVLSACSHGKLVDEGLQLYISMQRDYKIQPEMKHFACMVDLYARSGLLEQAFGFIEKMPVEPSEFIWAALLSSCRIYKNVELGENAAKKALTYDQYNAGVYILLSRIYADSGRWEDFSMVRLFMKELGLKPVTARSWVEVERKVYTFTVRDNLNPYSKKIYNLLETLKEKMEKGGFDSDRSGGGHNNISEEENESDLCGHTEKLALAFVLIKCGGHQGPIRIGKNLRVCTDCHESFKFISKITNREIILRDPNRYHQFKQGSCNCCDFW